MSWSDKLKRGAAVGVVAGVATQLIYGSGGYGNILGMELPASAVMGVAAGVGSVGADIAHESLPSMGLGEMGATVVEAGVAGLVTAGAANYLGVANGIDMEAIALGAGSLYAGRYLYGAAGGQGAMLI